MTHLCKLMLEEPERRDYAASTRALTYGRNRHCPKCQANARDPQRLDAEIGFFSGLHTWNQKLQHHPTSTVWFPPAVWLGSLKVDRLAAEFLPASRYSQRSIPSKFVDGLRKLHREHRLAFRFVRCSAPHGWFSRNVLLVGAQHALRYLGQYTHA